MSSQSDNYGTRDSSDITKQKKDRLNYLLRPPTFPLYSPQSFEYIYSFEAGNVLCNCSDSFMNAPIINYVGSAQTPTRGSGGFLSSITTAWFPVARALTYRVFLVECPTMSGPCPMTGGVIISTTNSPVLPSSQSSWTYTPTAGTYKRIFAFVVAYGRTRQSLPGIYSPEFSV